MTTEQLQEIKARLNKTTDTIWRTNMHNEILTSNGVRLGQMIRVQDAEFVIHAREDVPALIAEVERLREVLEFYADVENYHLNKMGHGFLSPIVMADGGYKARKALGEIKVPRTPEQNAVIDRVIANLNKLEGEKP
ncbi:hypothetical protein [Solibacillus isronensis]|uniref:hypothetical protein n=1 Tax=Solibacillus isronensis TaxID=412383 RepID=UPI0039A0C2BA